MIGTVMVLRDGDGDGPGSVPYTARTSLVAALAAVTSPAAAESRDDGDDAGPHPFSLQHFARPSARTFATLPHQCVAQRPA